MKRLQIICWYLAAMALPLAAFAQQKARPDPTDPKVSVAPVIYVSPLTKYQPLGEEQVTSWKAANDLVEKIGGWRVYTKEAQEPAPGAGQPAGKDQQPAPQTKPPTQGGHSGHSMK
jgi:hypothetical protein